MPNNSIKSFEYTVKSGVSIDYSFRLKSNEPRIANTLTSDVLAPLDYSDPAWTRFYRGKNREIIVPLGDIFSVSGFSITFLQNLSAGIYTPENVEFFVSENGEDFMLAYSVPSLVSRADTDIKYSRFSIIDGSKFKASTIKIVFDCEVFAFGCKFELYSSQPDGSENNFVKSSFTEKIKGYKLPSSGFSSTALIYCGYWNSTMNYDEHYVKNTAKSLLPYVAYIDKYEKIADTMFDSVLFLYLQSKSPSGGKTVFFTGEPNSGTVKSDFDYFISNLFEDNYNINALEQAAEKVKNALGLKSYKVAVSVQLPYVYKTEKPFGDINDDGKDEFSRTIEERVIIYDYYIKKIIDTFNSHKYKNIYLSAFYQGCESVPFTASDDEYKLFKRVNALIHANAKKSTWIPCFLGAGFDISDELGFDFSYMQPNYMFQNWKGESLGEFAEIIKKYGLGAEIELNYTAVNPHCDTFETDSDKYIEYFDYGYEYGYMNSALAFYQGAGPGYLYDAAYSKNQKIRSLYKKTYKFIKGGYVPANPDDYEELPSFAEINAVKAAETAKKAIDSAAVTTKTTVKKLQSSTSKIKLDKAFVITAGAVALGLVIAACSSKKKKRKK